MFEIPTPHIFTEPFHCVTVMTQLLITGDIIYVIMFRLTPKSRPNNIYIGLKCLYVRPSVRPQKVFPITMKFDM